MVEIAHTAFKATLMPRLARVHQRRRIGVFAGPPGLGKTTVARLFVGENAESTMLVTVPRGRPSGMRESAAMQLVLEAFYDLVPESYRRSYPQCFVELRMRLYQAIREWLGSPYRKDTRYHTQLLTIVFDEAQNLSEDAIESLRYLNDEGAGFSPIRLGLIFIGNATFRLKANNRGQSILTDAVRDRALYTDVFNSDDITDDDLALLMDARGIVDPDCQRLVIKYFKSGRVDRSIRRLEDHMSDLEEEAGGDAVTAETFRLVVGLN